MTRISMGTLIGTFALALSLPGNAWAQDRAANSMDDYGLAEARRDFRKIELSQEDMAVISSVLSKDARELELARAEIREVQARVARLMLEREPNLEEIRKSVRQSLESEFRLRMAQIERNLALRRILGDDRWAALSRLSRVFEALAKSGRLKDLAERSGDLERLAPLLEILKSLQ